MAKENNKKRSIAQWTGVILALGASPLMFVISMLIGTEIGGGGGLGVILGILFLCLGIYLFALLISKVTYFIIK